MDECAINSLVVVLYGPTSWRKVNVRKSNLY